MHFDPNQTERFTTDGTTFEFNYERTEYLSGEILDQYETQIKKMGKLYKKTNNRDKKYNLAQNILALHGEWNVKDNDETLYLIFNENDECFTDVITENEYYANPIEEQ